jgi:hypothetical protein
MGKIAILQPTSAPQGFVRAGNPGSGVDFGGLARGLGQLADAQQRETDLQNRKAEQEAEQQRREAERAQRQQQQDEARVTVLRTIGEAQAQFTERLAAAKDGAPGDAAGFTAGILKEFDTWQKGATEGVPELARRLFEEQAIQLKGQLHSQSFAFETVARQKNLAAGYDASLDAARRTVWADPGQFTDQLARHVATARTMAVPEELRTKMVEIARDKLAFDAASGMTERNPNAVLEKLGFPPGKWQPGMPLPDTSKTADAVKNDPVFSSLPPDKLQAVLHRALSLSAAQGAQAQRANDEALREAEKATKGLQDFTLTGALVSNEYRDQVLAATKGTPFEAQARTLLQASVSGAAIGSQSLTRQEQTIRAMEARAAQGTDPEQQKLLDQARAIHATQRKAYEDNPWQAATRFARVPEVPEAQISSAEQVPQLVAQRLAMIGAVESAAGAPVSVLQPGEAVAFAGKLAGLPTDQQATVLGATGAQLTGPRINALADQLDSKNRPMALALKLGSDQTTAGRNTSALVLAGAQAIADKRVKRDDAVLTGWRSEISTIVRGTLGDPKAEQDAIDAAYYVRAAMDADGSAVPGFDLKASIAQAVKLVMGEVIEREGVKTILPRGMDESAFTDKVRRLYNVTALKFLAQRAPNPEAGYKGDAAQPAQFYVRGRPIPVESFAVTLPGMAMKRTGSGQYIPVMGGAFVTTDPDQTKPLLLEMR